MMVFVVVLVFGLSESSSLNANEPRVPAI